MRPVGCRRVPCSGRSSGTSPSGSRRTTVIGCACPGGGRCCGPNGRGQHPGSLGPLSGGQTPCGGVHEALRGGGSPHTSGGSRPTWSVPRILGRRGRARADDVRGPPAEKARRLIGGCRTWAVRARTGGVSVRVLASAQRRPSRAHRSPTHLGSRGDVSSGTEFRDRSGTVSRSRTAEGPNDGPMDAEDGGLGSARGREWYRPHSRASG